MRREILRILFFASIAAIIPSLGPAEEADGLVDWDVGIEAQDFSLGIA